MPDLMRTLLNPMIVFDGDGGSGSGGSAGGDGGDAGKGGSGDDGGGDGGGDGQQQQQVDESQLGDAGKRALEQERQARRDAEKKLADKERQIELASKSEKERLEAERDDAKAKAKAAELRADRLSVGLKAGLPPEIAERVRGDTEEEMKTDAEELKKAFGDGGGDNGGGGFGGGPRGGRRPDPNDMNAAIRRAAGRA